MKREKTEQFFFRHLRDGRSLRESPFTWLAIGGNAEVLPEPLIVRAVHDRLSNLVDDICARPAFTSKCDRTRRLREIFRRHLLGGEHWSSLASELFVSRRQFFRERKLLCDELTASLQSGVQALPEAVLVQPSPEGVAFNEAYLALQAGNLDSAERLLQDLSASLPLGVLRSQALALAAECASDRLRFDAAATLCAHAMSAAEALTNFEDRVLASAHVNVTRSRSLLLLSDYHSAHLELESALRGLSRLSSSAGARRSEIIQAILVRKAELALHVGDFNRAVDYVHRAKYTLNDAACDAACDLASIEAGTEMVAGRVQSALRLLADALSSAQRLGFNLQVVRLSIDNAWIESIVENKRPALVATIAALAGALHIPEVTVEASLFCASNDVPAAAMEHASKARSASPPNSMWMGRAMLAQSVACLKLRRFADAWDLATEAERLTDRLENHRQHACCVAFEAIVQLKSGNQKSAQKLKSTADELMRRYAAVPERERFEKLIRTA